MTDQDIGMTDADADELSYHVPFVCIDEDGEVRVYAFDEKLQKYVIDEEATRNLDPEFVEDYKMADEYWRRRGDKDDFYSDDPGWQDDRGHALGF